MKVGFIGLGIMGSRMAANLLKAGHELYVFNRTRARADDLVGAGAQWCDVPAAVAAASEVIITMLETPAAVEAVFAGEHGLSTVTDSGKVWIDCSTVDPSSTTNMAQLAESVGYRFLEAPVAGSKQPAANGELVFLVGGAATDLELVAPLLDIMGKKTILIGPHGKGAAMKLVINLMLAQTMLAFSEGAALSRAMGIEEEQMMNILLNTPVAPAYLGAIRGKLENGDLSANFPLRLIKKDLQLVSETAYELGVPMPSANLAKDAYTQAQKGGHGEDDFSAIYQFLK